MAYGKFEFNFGAIGVIPKPNEHIVITDLWTGKSQTNHGDLFFVDSIPGHGNATFKF